MLLELFLPDARDFLVAVENDRARGRRALIDRENISAHMPLLGTRLKGPTGMRAEARIRFPHSAPLALPRGRHSNDFNTIEKRMSNENKTQLLPSAPADTDSALPGGKTQLSLPRICA
ncbi:hypothetical protein KEM44_12230 (plasmid) [Sinorhizobium meliloti]|nr:hypothetical protein KEM44_12230 [Sinorhizobium meliloti]